MNGSRDEDQADFDLGRFIDMFDQAMVSRDPRVVDALRSLMMMVILTKPEVDASPAVDRQRGPLRRMYEDLGDLNRRMSRVEEEIRHTQKSAAASKYSYSHSNPWDEFDRYPNEKYAVQAAKKMASTIDQEILTTLMNQTKLK